MQVGVATLLVVISVISLITTTGEATLGRRVGFFFLVLLVCYMYINVINLTNRFIAEVEAPPIDFVIPREFSTRPYWLDGFDKNVMKLRYQLGRCLF